uniref:Uncharacterized protein n=1 Tax=Romanomermis culicivorax TaxID=13658 RepID=A0A915K093_ROMCU
MSLPKLKSLSLHIPRFDYTQLDEDLPFHRIMKDLYFISLQNIKTSVFAEAR